MKQDLYVPSVALTGSSGKHVYGYDLAAMV